MEKCCNLHTDGNCLIVLEDGSTRTAGSCAFSCGAYDRCPMYVPESFCGPEDCRVASIEKRAAWEDVSAKAHAIVETGGVSIIGESPSEIEAVVVSAQVANSFPVSYGGPYNVTLSKRSWENSKNTGGWIQGFLCDCAWGQYNSGQPGGGYHGRFCSHAYAALLESNSRARKDFMGDRKTARRAEGICASCGCFSDSVSEASGNCRECDADIAFEAVVAAFASSDCDHSKVAAADSAIMSEIVDSMTVRSAGGDNYLVEWNGRKAMATKTSAEQYGELFGETPDGEYSYIVDRDEFGQYEVFVNSKDPFDSRIESECGSNYRIFDEEHEAVRWGEECMVRLSYNDFLDDEDFGDPVTAAYGVTEIRTNCGTVTLEQVGGMWCLYPGEEFAEQFGLDPDPVVGGPFEEFSASDPDEAGVIAQSKLEEEWGVRVEGNVVASFFDRTATRHFTYAEMVELEDEIEGRELHNTDRFKR